MPAAAAAPALALLAERIAAELGLHFPTERLEELRHGLAAAARDFGKADGSVCVDWLLSTPWTEARVRTLAGHLTVGETYFFRDAALLDVFAGHILPELAARRRVEGQRQLHLWSAGCCTGEEAYSLAILLGEALPDLAEWDATVMATDVNPRFLEKARAGRYREWSFRDAPAGLQQRHFERTPDGLFHVNARARALVTFAELNLAQETYPCAINGTQNLDVIFCRNLLMYFTEPQARLVVQRLQRCLREGGWLVVSRSEACNIACPGLEPVNFPSAVVFRNQQAGLGGAGPQPVEAAAFRETAAPEIKPVAPSGAPSTAQPATESVALSSQTACALADQGRLEEALLWCDRWIGADKFDAQAHYVRGVVLIELGDSEGARHALQRCVRLQPAFVVAHMALGQLARGRGRAAEAARHFGLAGRLLRALQPHDPLPEADGFTAGRLHETFGVMAVEGRP